MESKASGHEVKPRSPLRVVHQEPTGQVRLVEFERRFHEVMGRHFGTRFHRYREAWTLSSRFMYRPSFPLSLDLEINASCNLKCVMCVMGSPGYVNALADRPLMDPALYRSLMAQAEEHRLPAMTFGFLSEPLLHPSLAEMIEMARVAGVMDIRLGTNGLLMTSETAKRLIRSGLTRLEISLDAVRPKTYRRIRPGGNLDKVTRNIERFLEHRARMGSDFPLLRLSFLKLPYNDGELDDFLAQWRDKADLFSIQDPILFEGTPILDDLTLGKPGSVLDFRCAQPWQRLIVRADGQALPCCSIYGLRMRIGSSREKKLADLWTDPLMKELRNAHESGVSSLNHICRHCAERTALKVLRPDSEPCEEV